LTFCRIFIVPETWSATTKNVPPSHRASGH
jgi:hypothetical protein